MNLRITKYGNRNWAVWIGEELLAVTVYKKGARAVVDLVGQLSGGTTHRLIGTSGVLVACSHEHSSEEVAARSPLQLPGAA